MAKLETVLVVNPAGGFFRINKSDFNPSKHTLYVEAVASSSDDGGAAGTANTPEPEGSDAVESQAPAEDSAPAASPSPEAPKKKGKRG